MAEPLILARYDDLLADIRAIVRQELAAQRTDPPAQAPDPEALLSIRQAADALGVSISTIHEWKRQNLLPFARLGGRVYILRSALLAAAQPRPVGDGRRATARRGAGRPAPTSATSTNLNPASK